MERDDPAQCGACGRALAAVQTLLLPCLHSVCRACARTATTTHGVLDCPVAACGARVDGVAAAEDVGAVVLPHLLREVGLAAAAQQRCAACEEDVAAEDAAAEVVCTACEPAQALCGVHAGMHRKRAATKGHELKPLAMPDGPSDGGGGSGSGSSSGGGGNAPLFVLAEAGGGLVLACAVHPRKPVEVWCATCRRGVCLACTQTDHRLPEHATSLLDETVRTALITELAHAHTALVQRQEQLTGLVAELHSRTQTVQARTERLHTAVDDHVATLHAALDGRGAALHKLIDAAAALDLDPLAATEAAVARALAVRATPLALAAELTSTAQPPALPIVASLAAPVLRRVTELAAGTAPAVPAIATVELEFGSAVEAAIQQMGTVVQRRADPAKCTLAGAGLTAAFKGVDAELTLSTVDPAGAAITTGGEPVEASLELLASSGAGSGSMDAMTSTAATAATAAGDGGSSTRSRSPTKSPVALGRAVVGKAASVSALPPHSSSPSSTSSAAAAGAAAAAAAESDARPAVTVLDLGNGQYTIHYRPAAEGRHRLRVHIAGQDVAGSPAHIVVPAAFRDLSALGPPRVIVPMTDEITMCFAAEVGPGSPFAGDLLVTENSTHSVRVLSADPRRGVTFGANILQSPYGIAIAADGITVLVANGSHGTIERFTLPDGAHAGVAAKGLAVPVGVVGLADGGLLVACSGDHTVRRFDATSSATPRWTAGAVDNAGATLGAFANPAGIALHPGGRTALVADYSNQRVVVLGIDDGRSQRSWGTAGSGPGQLNGPMALAVTPDGQHVVVVDQGNNRVQVFRYDTGAFVHAWGGKGVAPGLLSSPCGVVIQPGGNIIIVDRFNKRLQFF